MAYDRYDTRRDQERGRYLEQDRDREGGRNDDRGFFERAGDEISSWWSGDEPDYRRGEERMSRGAGRDRDHDFDREESGRHAYRSPARQFGSGRDTDHRSSRPTNSTPSDRDYRPGFGGSDRDTGTRSGGGSERGHGRSDMDRGGYDRSETPWGRDDYRRTSSAGSGRDTDGHYHAWRQRQIDELDRDYDDYRREHQEKFSSDFGTWRQGRQQKRGLLGDIREQMDVVGSDGETVGKVDCVKGDRIILTKADSDDDRHHSIKCSMIGTVEGGQVRLDIPAEEAKSRFRDEDDRGFFGRDNRDSDDGHVNLERSFAGTYR